MAERVWSTRFICQRGLNGYSDEVRVPDGHVYVVKQLTAYMNPDLQTVRAWFEDLNSTTALFSCGQGTTADPITSEPAWFGFYGHLVFPAGEGFVWRTSATFSAGVDVYAGGYDLLAT